MRLLLLAALVRALLLPPHATIDPFGSRSLVAAAPDGRIAASVTVRGYEPQIVEWLPGSSGYRTLGAPGAVAAFAGDDLLVNAPGPSRVRRGVAEPIDFRRCEEFPQLSTGPDLAGALSNGALILTMRSPSLVDLDDATGRTAPVVLYYRDLCLNLGNGVALATSGAYTAGYAAYINDVAAPSNVISNKERFVAMRWHERTPQALGPGAAVAIAADGSAAGADVPPGILAAYAVAPHARVWLAGGAEADLAPNAPLSVAYAIDERGRVTGMLEDGDRRHYAFLWHDGRLERLDDLARAPGWRFECGYAFTADGSIAGIGTYRGVATGFVLPLHTGGR